MPHYRIEQSGFRGSCAFLVVAVAALIAGCASAPPAGTPVATKTTMLPAEKDRARVQVDGELGFTVTEVVHVDNDVRADYQRASALLAQNQLNEGVALLESIALRAPGLTAPHIDLGVAYGRMGAYEKAEKSLQAALALAPNHPAALNELGIVYRREGKFQEARTSYERALAIQPTYHYALRNLGVLCDLYLRDLQCALRNYQSYEEIVPDDHQVAMWITDIRNRTSVAAKE
jgi:Flp pilus assembly protein TadD